MAAQVSRSGVDRCRHGEVLGDRREDLDCGLHSFARHQACAAVTNTICVTPADRNTLAHSSAVLPDVRTSSTSTAVRPSKRRDRRAANASCTFTALDVTRTSP